MGFRLCNITDGFKSSNQYLLESNLLRRNILSRGTIALTVKANGIRITRCHVQTPQRYKKPINSVSNGFSDFKETKSLDTSRVNYSFSFIKKITSLRLIIACMRDHTTREKVISLIPLDAICAIHLTVLVQVEK